MVLFLLETVELRPVEYLLLDRAQSELDCEDLLMYRARRVGIKDVFFN